MERVCFKNTNLTVATAVESGTILVGEIRSFKSLSLKNIGSPNNTNDEEGAGFS